VRPKPLPTFLRFRSNVLSGPPFLLGTALFGSAALLGSLFDKHGRLQHRIARIWARNCIFSSGARLQVIGLENIPAEAAVFAANHTSYMDTPVVFASLPFQFRILAKKELWTLPFIGWYLNRSGQIPINTENPRATLSSLGAGVRTLRDGLSVFVFPEGGRTEDGTLQPFLNGAAYLAIRAQVPLVPIALIGVYDLLPIHTAHFYPSPDGTPLKLVFGEPIQTHGHTLRESEALTEQLREAIELLIQKHS
jgi:1-acyl-sn-glycerol-3-phosphate acyltransferase